MKQALTPEALATPEAPYSSVVVSGDLVVISGQVPMDREGAIVSDEFSDHRRIKSFRT